MNLEVFRNFPEGDPCETCKLCETALIPYRKLSGLGKAKVLIVYSDSHQDNQIIADRLRLPKSDKHVLGNIRSLVSESGFKTSDFYYFPMVRGLTKSKIANSQAVACSFFLFKTIKKLKRADKLKGIIVIGPTAWTALMHKRLSVGRINGMKYTDWIGDIIPDQELKLRITSLYHPRHMAMKSWNDKFLPKLWARQLTAAMKEFDKPFYSHNHQSECFVLHEKSEILDVLKKLNFQPVVAFDYETSGIKPFREGHYIFSVSVSDGLHSWAFRFLQNDPEFMKAWIKLMTNKKVKKIAHNNQFENIWTKHFCGVFPTPYETDTQLDAHVICNHKKTNLKYLVYKFFGIIYDSEVSGFLESVKKGENSKSSLSFNRIDEADPEKVLLYNAMDSLFTFKLAQLFKGLLDSFIIDGRNLLLQFNEAMQELTVNGLNISSEKLNDGMKALEQRMQNLEKRIMKDSVLEKWKADKPFNFNSTQQLGKLLYDILKLPCKKRTATGGKSVDVETLGEIDLPIVKNILKWRKAQKIKDTYLAQYSREQTKENKVNPFFYNTTVDTFRGSATNPNIKNVPKRDAYAKKIVRDIIIAGPESRIIEWDYKSIEVVIGACYHLDPNMLNYLADKNTDMHRDMACQIFFRTPETFLKTERQEAKNKFVFPEFYGSYYAQVAPDLWDFAVTSESTMQSLSDNGMKSFAKFEKFIQDIEHHFWTKRFPVYAQWKEEQWKKYCRIGYVKLKTGFKCFAPMDRKMVSNYPIQGTAFHVMMWALSNVIKNTRHLTRSRMIAEIYDAMVGDIHIAEENEFSQIVEYWGVHKVKEHFDWIVPPIELEKEISEIGGSWAEMSEE